MLAELLSKLERTAERAAEVHFHSHPELPGKILVAQGNTYQTLEAPPPQRGHYLSTLSSFVGAVSMLGDSLAEVFCGADGLVATLDGDRRAKVCMPLRLSERWRSLLDLRRSDSMSVSSAVKMLRFDLHGTGVDSVIQALGRVDFTRKSDGTSVVEHGKETLGRAVEAAVQQSDQIPEEFSVEVPIFVNPGLRGISTKTVRCGVYLDVAEERVQIRPLADQMTNAVDAALEAIGEQVGTMLSAAGKGELPVFVGVQ